MSNLLKDLIKVDVIVKIADYLKHLIIVISKKIFKRKNSVNEFNFIKRKLLIFKNDVIY